MPHRRRTAVTVGIAAAALGAGLLMSAPAAGAATAVRAASPAAGEAPGAPGVMSHFDLARKDCLGTARNTTSKVWYTVAGGVLSDVYYPTIDNTNVETLQYVVTDGTSFTDLQTRDTTYTVRALDAGGMACRVVSTAKSGRYQLVTDYLTDPRRDSVVLRTTLLPKDRHDKLAVYVRFDATVNGNGGGGAGQNAGAGRRRDRHLDQAPRAGVDRHEHPDDRRQPRLRPARLRGSATPTARSPQVSSGFAGTPSDGLAQLDASHALTTTYATATHGNVVQTAQVDAGAGQPFQLALGFGSTQKDAVTSAGKSADASFDEARQGLSQGLGEVRRRAAPRGLAAGPLARAARRPAPHVPARGERPQGQRGQDVPRCHRRLPRQPLGSGRRRRRPGD